MPDTGSMPNRHAEHHNHHRTPDVQVAESDQHHDQKGQREAFPPLSVRHSSIRERLQHAPKNPDRPSLALVCRGQGSTPLWTRRLPQGTLQPRHHSDEVSCLQHRPAT